MVRRRYDPQRQEVIRRLYILERDGSARRSNITIIDDEPVFLWRIEVPGMPIAVLRQTRYSIKRVDAGQWDIWQSKFDQPVVIVPGTAETPVETPAALYDLLAEQQQRDSS